MKKSTKLLPNTKHGKKNHLYFYFNIITLGKNKSGRKKVEKLSILIKKYRRKKLDISEYHSLDTN